MNDDQKIIKLLEEQGKTLARIEKLIAMKETESKKSTKTAIPEKQKKMTVPALLLLFKEDNFFDEAKTLNDISQKLKEESRNVPTTSLTLPLQRLVRSRQLVRILKNGKWSYAKRV